MRKTALNALVALVIVGSTGQMAAASERHLGKAYHAPVVARDIGAYRRAYNQWNGSYDAPANRFGFSGRDPSPVGGGNTWLHPGDINPSGS
jgi:hypothetical protein